MSASPLSDRGPDGEAFQPRRRSRASRRSPQPAHADRRRSLESDRRPSRPELRTSRPAAERWAEAPDGGDGPQPPDPGARAGGYRQDLSRGRRGGGGSRGRRGGAPRPPASRGDRKGAGWGKGGSV